MAISRADLLKQLLPGLNALFNVAYEDHSLGFDAATFGSYFVRRGCEGKYQVWECGLQPNELVASNIDHRREALALIKLLKSTQGE
jgi:hypothetical protein